MKTRFVLVLTVAIVMIATSAMAVFMPPNGPTYIKFTNMEQISAGGNIISPDGVQEVNWGVLDVTSVATGDATVNQQEFLRDTAVWADNNGGEITGIFANLTASPDVDPFGRLLSSGGSMYLYWDDADNANLNTSLPTDRTGDFAFTNFTDGNFLAKIDFLNGAMDANLGNTSIIGGVVPKFGGFIGFADSFGSVDTTVVGLWTEILDTNYFHTALGLNTADLMFKNSYTGADSHPWNGIDPSGGPIFGATSDDPARAYVVPEPSTFILMGAGLIGLIGWRRRK